MGSWLSRNRVISSPPVYSNYNGIRSTLKPFDLVLFSGTDVISSAIKFAEKRELVTTVGKFDRKSFVPLPSNSEDTIFSHVGIVVTSDILNHPNIIPGGMYILESTASGDHGFGIPNIDGKSFIGVQVRNLDLLIPAYLKEKDNKVAIAPLLSHLNINSKIKEKFTTLYNEVNGTPYDFNLIDLGCTVFEWCRRYKSLTDRIIGSGTWLFCSELVAIVYKEFGIIPDSIDPADISPMGYVGYESPSIPETQGTIPIIAKLPPTYIVMTT